MARKSELVDELPSLIAVVSGSSNVACGLTGLSHAGQTLTNQRPHSRSRSRLTWGVSLMSNKSMISLQTAPVAIKLLVQSKTVSSNGRGRTAQQSSPAIDLHRRPPDRRN